MNEPAALGFAVAFLAGLLSFLSPCVLPLVPSYVGFITGMTLPEVSGRRRTALIHALLFVAGFSLVFILLGASATALGRALNYYQVWLSRVGGVLIILFGLLCLGVFRIGALNQERRLHLERKPVGYLGRRWWVWLSGPDGPHVSVRYWVESWAWPPPPPTSPVGCSYSPRTLPVWRCHFWLRRWQSSPSWAGSSASGRICPG